MRLLAIDPGKEKCGLALVEQQDGGEIKIVIQEIVPTQDLERRLLSLRTLFTPFQAVIGDGTYSKPLRQMISRSYPDLQLSIISEKDSTLEARGKYFKAHPPRGIWKLVPLSLQVPPVPYDDFVAVLLAERFLEKPGRQAG